MKTQLLSQLAMVEKPACKHYEKYGHEETNCCELVGYPPSWGSHGRGCGSREGRARHVSRTSGGRSPRIGCETVHTTLTDATASGSNAIAEQSQVSIPGLTSKQIQRLLNLIEVPKAGCNPSSGTV